MAFNNGYFQPQLGGYGQPMQNVYQLPAYQSAQTQQTVLTDQPLFCRFATKREEVEACQVDFSGRPMTFIGPNQETVWIKTFNFNTGGSDVVEYHPAAPAKSEKTAAGPTMEDFRSLHDLVIKQGEELSRLKGATRRRAARETEECDDV